jgi:hypothetical protein
MNCENSKTGAGGLQWRNEMKMRRGDCAHSPADSGRLSVFAFWTPSAEVLYANLGWVRLERFDYCGHEISVRQRELRSQANPPSQIGTPETLANFASR